MAVSDSKRFRLSTQPTRPKLSLRKPPKSSRNSKKPKKRKSIPPSLRYVETRRGKTTVRRYNGRSIFRLEEVKGKPVECVEIFDSDDDHSISVRFQDKTAISFSIEPSFTLFTDYADWKTGNWRPIKGWRPIHSQGLRVS
jgi:hypothetical protein